MFLCGFGMVVRDGEARMLVDLFSVSQLSH